MADGHTFTETRTASGKRIVEAFAEHDLGITSERNPLAGGPSTRIALGRPYKDGGRFVAIVDGFRAEGEIVEFSHHSDAYRLTLAPEPDCAVTLRFSTDPAEAPVATTLQAFLAENDFEPEERIAIRNRVMAGGLYCGGGGAAQEWFLYRADVPAERFINSDGSHFFTRAA